MPKKSVMHTSAIDIDTRKVNTAVRKKINRKDYVRLRKRLLDRLRTIHVRLNAAYAARAYEAIEQEGDNLWLTQMLLARIRKKFYGRRKSRPEPETPVSVVDP